jgi:inhibitor of the pro-sigma K processing machinery
MFDLDLNLILAIIFGLMILYLLARVLAYPMRALAKAAGHFLVGALLLIFFNLVGGLVGLGVGVNILTALVVGFLGVPGLLTLLIIQRILS